MRRRGTWTLLIVALVLAAAGALAPVAGAKPPKPAPPSTEAPRDRPGGDRTTTTAPPPSTEPGFQVAVAPAPEPKVAVTPTRDLEHLQTVHVTGTGYAAGEGIQVVQCRDAASFFFGDCDTGTTRFIFADDAGSWATDVTVLAAWACRRRSTASASSAPASSGWRTATGSRSTARSRSASPLMPSRNRRR